MNDIKIIEYKAGAIGKIIELNAKYFINNFNFNSSFEIEITKYCSNFFSNYNSQRDHVFLAVKDDTIIGSLLIDGKKDKTEGSQIRLFIVDPFYQRQKIGSLLLKSAIEYCYINKHKIIFLWTFKKLTGAIKLYKLFGFSFLEERSVNYWNQDLVEQKFQLDLS